MSQRALFAIVVGFLVGYGALVSSVHPAPAADTSPFAWGYTDRLSYAPGDTLFLYLSASLSPIHVQVMRVGLQQQEVWRGPVPGVVRPIPKDASSHGCNWPVSLALPIPGNWTSGYYEIFLGGAGPDSAGQWVEGQTLFFVVRSAHPGRDASILLQLTTNTYNAYNNWGGSSLYPFNSTNGKRVNQVSFMRPLASQIYEWELPFIQWAETNGYRMEYATNHDLEERPEILSNYALVLSVGHDEYWSAPMRDALESHIANGGNVAFLGGNNVCWQVRFENDGLTMVSYKKAFEQDPLYEPSGPNPLLTTLWSHVLVGRPENLLTGVGFPFGGMHRHNDQFMDGSGAFTVHRPDHWAFEGTGLEPGDTFGEADRIVGYECDGCEIHWQDGIPYPTHRDGTPPGFLVLATAPVSWPAEDIDWYEAMEPGRTGTACMGLYSTGSGGTVFTASTTGWAHGLRGNDPVVVRITRNVIDRLSH